VLDVVAEVVPSAAAKWWGRAKRTIDAKLSMLHRRAGVQSEEPVSVKGCVCLCLRCACMCM